MWWLQWRHTLTPFHRCEWTSNTLNIDNISFFAAVFAFYQPTISPLAARQSGKNETRACRRNIWSRLRFRVSMLLYLNLLFDFDGFFVLFEPSLRLREKRINYSCFSRQFRWRGEMKQAMQSYVVVCIKFTIRTHRSMNFRSSFGVCVHAFFLFYGTHTPSLRHIDSHATNNEIETCTIQQLLLLLTAE